MARSRSKPLPRGVHERRHRSGALTYSIDYRDAAGARRQEAAGSSIAEAVALLARRRSEATEGHRSDVGTGAQSLAVFSIGCFADRKGKGVRTIAREAQLFRDHIAPHLGARRLVDITPRDVERWIDSLTASGDLSPKSILNAHGVLGAMLQRAKFLGLVPGNPARDLPRGTLPRNVRRHEKAAWTRAELATLITDARIPEVHRIANAIASFTAARVGEVAGMRWRDLDVDAPGLWRWSLRTQYDGLPLKSERATGEHPRDVPIHPTLAALLAAWKLEGWSRHVGRHPKPSDFVTPRDDGRCHSDDSLGAKPTHRHASTVGIDSTGRDFHSFRRAMITHARADGAREEYLERVTHNAKGTMLDRYTYAGWGELCAAVSCLRLELRRDAAVIPLRRASGGDDPPEGTAALHRDAPPLDGDARGDAGGDLAISRPETVGGGGSRTPLGSRQTAVSRGEVPEIGSGAGSKNRPRKPGPTAIEREAVTRVTVAASVEGLAVALERAGDAAAAADLRAVVARWRSS